jgi:hypothetical protein
MMRAASDDRTSRSVTHLSHGAECRDQRLGGGRFATENAGQTSCRSFVADGAQRIDRSTPLDVRSGR